MTVSTIAVDLPRARLRRPCASAIEPGRRCLRLMNPLQPNAVNYYANAWIMADGSVRVAGGNNYHEQAHGDSAYQQTLPGHVPLPEGLVGTPVMVAAAFGQTAILTNGGDVCLWGYNGHGQLGNGSTANAGVPTLLDAAHIEPRSGSLLRRVVKLIHTSVDNGLSNTWYALSADGKLWAWGYNGYGQLGVGDTSSTYTVPTAMQRADGTAMDQVADLYATGSNTGAVRVVRRDGGVWACGYNGYGQLGVGDAANRNRLTPVNLSALAGDRVVKVRASGGQYAVAALLTRGRRLFMCGYNGQGACGLGHTTSPVTVPAEVTGGISGAIADVWPLFDYPSLYARHRDGRLFAWGQNQNGQLGLGNTTSQTTPAPVTLGPLALAGPIVKVAGGGSYASAYYNGCIALSRDGRVFTAGYSAAGAGLITASSVFREWLRPTLDCRFVDVDAANYTSAVGYLALTDDGQVFACGRNNAGKLGIGHANDAALPQRAWF